MLITDTRPNAVKAWDQAYAEAQARSCLGFDQAWDEAHAHRRARNAAVLRVGDRAIVRERATLHGEEFYGGARIVDFGLPGDVAGAVTKISDASVAVRANGVTQYLDAEVLTVVTA